MDTGNSEDRLQAMITLATGFDVKLDDITATAAKLHEQLGGGASIFGEFAAALSKLGSSANIGQLRQVADEMKSLKENFSDVAGIDEMIRKIGILTTSMEKLSKAAVEREAAEAKSGAATAARLEKETAAQKAADAALVARQEKEMYAVDTRRTSNMGMAFGGAEMSDAAALEKQNAEVLKAYKQRNQQIVAQESERQAEINRLIDVNNTRNRESLAQQVADSKAATKQEINNYEAGEAERTAILKANMDRRQQMIREAQATLERETRTAQSLSDKVALTGAALPSTRIGIERDIALRGITNPGIRSSMTSSYETLIQRAMAGEQADNVVGITGTNAASGGGAGGPGLYQRLRGGVQGLMALGVGDYRMYYGVNALMNTGLAQKMFGVNTGGGQAGPPNDPGTLRLLESMGVGGVGVGGTAGAGEGAAGGGMMSGMAGMAVGATAAAAAFAIYTGAMVSAANATSQHVRELRNLGQELGTTTQGARELEGMAKVSGVSIDTIVAGMRQLTQGITESTGRGKGAAGVLQSIGVSPETNTGNLKDTKQLLFEISDAIKGMGDLQGRDVLERLFGRGGRNLLPLMKEDMRGLSAEMDRFNNGANDEAALRYAEHMSQLGLIYDGLKQKFANPLFVVLDFITGSTSDEIDRGLAKLPPYYLQRTKGGINMSPLDNMASKQMREQWQAAQENTPEGLRLSISTTEQDLQQAVNKAGTAPGTGDTITPDQQQRNQNAVKTLQAQLEAQKARLKMMTEQPALELAARKTMERSQYGEQSGYGRLYGEYISGVSDSSEAGSYTPAMSGYLYGTFQSNLQREAERVNKVWRQGQAGSDIQATRQQIEINKAGLELGTPTTIQNQSDVNARYRAASGIAGLNYSQVYGGVQDLRTQLANTNPLDFNAQDGLRKQISSAGSAAQTQYIIDMERAKAAARKEGVQVTRELAEAEARYYAASAEGARKLHQVMEDLQFNQASSARRNAFNTLKARTPSGTYNSAMLTGIDEQGATQDAILNMQRLYRDTAYNRQSIEDQYSASMALPGNTDKDKQEYAAKRSEELQQTQLDYLTKYGQMQQTIDDNHAKAVEESAQIIRQQNEAVTEFSENIFSAYLTSRLERRPGSFPIREAIGKYIVGYAQKAEGSIVSEGFGFLQNSGILPNSVLPGMTRQGPGSPIYDDAGRISGTTGHSQELTGFGKLWQGVFGKTPLGIRPAKAGAGPEHITSEKDIFDKMTRDAETGNAQHAWQDSVKDADKVLNEILDKLNQHWPATVAPSEDPSKAINTIGNMASASLPGWGGPSSTGLPIMLPGSGASIPSMTMSMGSAAIAPGAGGVITLPSGGTITPGGSMTTIPGISIPGTGTNPTTMPGGMSTDDMAGYASAVGPYGPGMTPAQMAQAAAMPGVSMQMGPDGTPQIIDSSGKVIGTQSNPGGGLNLPSMTMGFGSTANDLSSIASLAGGLSGAIKSGSSQIQSATGLSPDAVSDIAAGVGAGAALIKGIATAPAAFKKAGQTSTGAGTVAQDTGTVLGDAAAVASAIPGGQIVGGALEIGAMVAAGVAAIFGNPRATRQLQLSNEALQNTWTAPSAYNLVTSTNGQSVGYNSQGQPGAYNGPMLAYPNTSAYTIGYDYTFNRNYGAPVPGGVQPVSSPILSVEINALDSKSIMDNAHVLTDAVHAAVNSGHVLRNTISSIASPQ